MFQPKGWISLREIFEYISYSYATKQDHHGWEDFTGDEPFELTWEFAENAFEVAVCNLNGQAIEASPLLVIADNSYDNSNSHVDLSVGTVGSGNHRRNSDKRKTDAELLEEYGPFLYLPIIFKRDYFIDFLSEFEGGETDKEDNSPKATKKRIIQLLEKEGAITFAYAQELYGASQSVRQFRFAWNLAREVRPELSRPGRRPNGRKP